MSTSYGYKPQIMSIFGVLAVAATLGALQIASGEAASGATLADRFPAFGESSAIHGINRAAKRDREVTPPRGEAQHRTVLLKLEGVDATSVFLRIPGEKQVRKLAPPPTDKPAAERKKMAVACEPPVSVLTEVAKLLQPGRCVT